MDDLTLSPSRIAACIPTRGDVDMAPILDGLIFPTVIVADGPGWKVAARYMAMLEAATRGFRYAYTQDDDCLVPGTTQWALLLELVDEDVVTTYGHGTNPDGLEDIPLVHGGAIVRIAAALDGILRYGAHHPLDDDFKYEADVIVGALYRYTRTIDLPFELRDVCFSGNRMCDQPWQRDLKHAMAQRARRIRDAR